MRATSTFVGPSVMPDANIPSMPSQPLRRAAVAGTWYPGTADALAAAVDRHLAGVKATPRGTVVGLVSPHAGLMYSGPVAAYAYRAAAAGPYDVAVLVGPSHHMGFDGVAVYPRGAFDTPLGPLEIAEADAAAILRHCALVRDDVAAHVREHSLEMQLPFLARLLPSVPIVPLVMGYQTRDTIEGLADGLVKALAGRRALLVASSDLSHYLDARAASAADATVIESLRRQGGSPKAVGIMAHLVAAAHLWLSRTRGENPKVAVWPKISLDECTRGLMRVFQTSHPVYILTCSGTKARICNASWQR